MIGKAASPSDGASVGAEREARLGVDDPRGSAELHTPDLDRIDEIVERLLALDVSEAAVEPIRDWVRDRRAGKPQTVMFFGTWGQVGHYWWEPGSFGPVRPRRSSSLTPVGPWGQVDGALTPRETSKQSAAAIHHKDGWTAIALHDYTVDSRGGSNAAFVMDSALSFDRAMRYAEEAFPAVVKRITEAAPITLAVTCLDCEGGPEHARRR